MKKKKEKKSPCLCCFTGEFSQRFKELTSILYNLPKRIEDKGALPSSFYETSVNCDTKTRQR